jgi:hypothetical protein
MSQPASNLSSPGNETQELIRHLRAKKGKYFLIILLAGLLSFYFIKYRYIEYSATSSFFVNDRSMVSNTSLENLPYGDNLNRIYQMVNSTQTQIHLINSFNLYKQYGIDTTREFHLQEAIAVIRSKIDVKKNPYNAIIVTVKDKDRYQSAEMANEVVNFIEKLNQEFYIKNIQNTVQLSQAYLIELEQESKMKSISIDSLIKDINNIINSGRINNANLYYLLLQQQKLSELINIFKTSANDILNANKLYNLSLQTINFNNFPTVSVIQKAMPDYSSGTIKVLLYSLLIMILVFLFLILQAYFILHYNGYLKLLITGK